LRNSAHCLTTDEPTGEPTDETGDTKPTQQAHHGRFKKDDFATFQKAVNKFERDHLPPRAENLQPLLEPPVMLASAQDNKDHDFKEQEELHFAE